MCNSGGNPKWRKQTKHCRLPFPRPRHFGGEGAPAGAGEGAARRVVRVSKYRRYAPHGTTPSPDPAGPPSLAKRGRERQAAVLRALFRLKRFFLHFGLHPAIREAIKRGECQSDIDASPWGSSVVTCHGSSSRRAAGKNSPRREMPPVRRWRRPPPHGTPGRQNAPSMRRAFVQTQGRFIQTRRVFI
jgi:hypothetical protein